MSGRVLWRGARSGAVIAEVRDGDGRYAGRNSRRAFFVYAASTSFPTSNVLNRHAFRRHLLTDHRCGASCDDPLPPTAADVHPNPKSLERLRQQAAGIAPILTARGGAFTEAETGCFLPIPDRGRPIIGKVLDGVFVGGGLSCWGITQGPGTGLVLSELILEGRARTADISKLAP